MRTMVETAMGNAMAIPYLFDSAGMADFGRLVDTARREDEAEKKERRLRCAACRRLITRVDERIAVQGGHEHTCTNPHGIVYRFGCFRNAEGCVRVGELTAEWSWFRGFKWAIALCAGCRVHVGWYFQGPNGEGFHGLVLNRLMQ